MQIVTLTTDFGEQDYYVAALKGAMLSQYVAINFVDITHNIKDYNIVHAAYTIKHSYQNFPKGTIHLLSVNNFYEKNPVYLLLKYNEHYFLGPDNGIFSLVFDNVPSERFILPIDFQDIGTYKRAYAYAVGFIAKKENSIEKIGLFAEVIDQRFSLQPVIGETQIRGSVIHIDNYENVVLNITKDLWSRYHYYHRFSLFFKRHEPINELSVTYSDVAIGDNLCLFNAANHLEIAINMGKASSMLSLNLEDTVQVEFY